MRRERPQQPRRCATAEPVCKHLRYAPLRRPSSALRIPVRFLDCMASPDPVHSPGRPMSNPLLIHATGLAALALNVVALTCTCERALRLRSGASGVIWALNNFLLGANVAAALSVISA